MEDNIKMVLNEIGCEGFDWSYLVQDRMQWQALVTLIGGGIS
jgi:hypothetical protein